MARVSFTRSFSVTEKGWCSYHLLEVSNHTSCLCFNELGELLCNVFAFFLSQSGGCTGYMSYGFSIYSAESIYSKFDGIYS